MEELVEGGVEGAAEEVLGKSDVLADGVEIDVATAVDVWMGVDISGVSVVGIEDDETFDDSVRSVAIRKLSKEWVAAKLQLHI